MSGASQELYLLPPPVASRKDPVTYFAYKNFDIRNYRGLSNVSLNFTKNDMVLLLGLNESGKTSILKAIETFDYTNDPRDANFQKSFFTSIRNKQDLESHTPCIITAEVEFGAKLPSDFFKAAIKQANLNGAVNSEARSLLETINTRRAVRISRVIPFSDGNAGKSYYKFEGQDPFSTKEIEAVLAQELVRRCPYIIYFEDFQDAIPGCIYTSKQNHGYNAVWYEILDGLFYNTSKEFSIRKYLDYYVRSNRRDDDARTVLKKVNKKLKETFTEKWVNLSGVRDIEEAELIFQEKGRFFEIKITETDGTTYSVHERSKGAVWYLAFLMKTEFRRKKLREGSGKPVYLIDEPASNLHSTAQEKMVGDFYRLVEDTTLIYTTHSRYLVSASNVKNTFVIERKGGKINCTKWGEYIQGREAKISYYQPLYDCLEIVPNNFDIPWKRAIITEGPGDALVLELMRIVLGIEFTHAIYPGSSASNLDTLIALNVGWHTDFKVLFDSDKEGSEQQEAYSEQYGLCQDRFVMLPMKTIEKMFTMGERASLFQLATGAQVASPTKKQFLAAVRALRPVAEEDDNSVNSLLSEASKERFRLLFTKLEV